MNRVLKDFMNTLSRVNKYYGFTEPEDEKDAKCLAYTERCRVVSNLRRTYLFTYFLIFYLLAAIVLTPMRRVVATVIPALILAMFALIGFTFAASYLYKKATEKDEPLPKKLEKKIKITYTIYWFIYFLMTIACDFLFTDWYQGLVIWLPMMLMGFLIPVVNMQEGFLIDATAIISLILFLWQGSTEAFEFTRVAVAFPAFIICIVVTDINHLERLNYFYQTGAVWYETNASARRLGNVFEEVFDMAFEFDVRTGKVVVLRNNDKYSVKYDKGLLDFGEFTNFIKNMVHPDDALTALKIMDPVNIENQFMNESRSQIYSEGRILNSEGDYSWVSVLLTREKKIENEFAGGEYILCLIQNIDERKKNEDRLKLEAEKDPLTQLYNKMTTRSLIEETLEKNSSASHALLIIDIDNFKTINDTRGHTVGDQILVAFANELNRNFRESDILGRAGGDEFIVLLKNVQSVAMICDKLQQLTSSFKKYGIDHGLPGRLSTSIGVAMFNKDGKTYEELFKKADAALYEAKRNGKDQYKFSITKI